jgi:hypothetical protein
MWFYAWMEKHTEVGWDYSSLGWMGDWSCRGSMDHNELMSCCHKSETSIDSRPLWDITDLLVIANDKLCMKYNVLCEESKVQEIELLGVPST